MATPPPVTAADAQDAIERIAARRAKIDDPNAWRLSEDPIEVLLYLRRYSQGVPGWVAEADVLDGLTLRLRLWWLGEESELWLLERAQRLSMAPRQLARQLGVKSRQAVHDRLRLARRKISKLTGEPPYTTDLRRGEREADEEARWLDRNRNEILDIARAAASFRGLADEEAAEWLADVARDLAERVVTPGSLQTLRFALVELSTSAAVRQLEPGHVLHTLLLRWSRLYATHPRS